MAWSFGLSAECGPDEAGAEALADHFDAWDRRTFQDVTGNWWCHVTPAGMSRVGVQSEADAEAMTALGHALYDRLRTAPPNFRYALAGVETDEFRRFDELREDADLTIFPGLVLSDAVWETHGRPPDFVPFAPGYRWLPYAGEHHA